MTRKDYIVIAHALGVSLKKIATSSPVVARGIAEGFADQISHTNPAFKREVFVKAVMSECTFSNTLAK